MIRSMYEKITPFESILNNFATALKGIMNNLNKVSGELNNNLQSSLGDLQYQDVTSQETGHIIDFLKNVEETSVLLDTLEKVLSEDEKKQIKKELLVYLDEICTTGGEAEQIEKFGTKWQVEYKKESEESFDELDDGTFLF